MIKDLFVGWYDYSKEDFRHILLNGKISLDTNVLLSIYKYSKETSLETMSKFNIIKERLIFSYYVAEEFSRNRKKVESDSLCEYDKYISSINDKYDDLLHEIDKIPEKRITEKAKIKDQINKNRDKTISSIQDDKTRKEKLFTDGLESKICDLIDNEIIQKYDDAVFEKVKQEGLRRVKEQIPPGYMDNEKDVNGDYHIFRSLIDYCKTNNCDLIFVTDDCKEDIFVNLHGIKQPRPELLNEFYNETNHRLIIFTLQEFLKNDVIFKDKISAKALDEISFMSSESYFITRRNSERIKRFLYSILQYDNIDSVVHNYDEILKNYRTILRICEGINDEVSFKKYYELYSLLESQNYDLYLSKIESISNTAFSEKEETINRINSYYNKYKETSIDEIGIELCNLFIKYINIYLHDNYNYRPLVSRLRSLLRNYKDDPDFKEMLSNEIEVAYRFIKYGEMIV